MSVIACKLDPNGRGERQQLLAGLIARAFEYRETDNGFAFHFSPEVTTMVELAGAVEPERRCCPFLRLVIAAEPEGGPLGLELTGPEGAKELLRGLLNLG